uniref:Enkurin domain-containing protein n=1 Tax=Alexandrium monilatum TaxID=311494 RepID=A0A7S4QZJ6_9DINO|mmetsp:Transcript_92696/g.294069  ORF Transcript_92696/g.294069 Transcript_92696/m.294069 type:complete len:358 (+) Transcript_92696:109-1182(+)
MPSVREVMLARAKEPAKIFSMERVSAAPSPSNSAPAAAEPPAAPGSACPTPSGGTPGAARPPRPRVAPGSGGSAGAAGPRAGRAQEGRRPTANRTPSEPPGAGGAAARGAGPGAQAKARSSSANARPKMGGPPPPVERKDVGKVPAYLKRRQEEMAEAKRQAERPVSPQPPPGYRKVDEAEKQGTLDVLRQRKAEVEKAQRNLPFKIETVGQKNRESDLSNRMAHIDKLMGMFSQPRVFIPVDAEPIAVSIPPLAGASPAADREDGGAAAGAQRGRNGGGMREAMQRPSSGEDPQRRQPSRESRAAANAERRRQNSIIHPWEQDSPGAATAASSPVKTGVQVAAPPGGKSNFSFDWQ